MDNLHLTFWLQCFCGISKAVSRNEYDDKGNVLTSTDARGNVTTSAYDDKGNLTSVTDAAGNSISIAYNDKNQAVRLTNINDDDIIINYDSAGSIISTTDADGYKTLYTYNDRNQPVTEETPEGKLTYSYDANGNLVSKSESQVDAEGNFADSVITESYTYDSFNRMIKYESGDISYSYTYNAEGVRRSRQNDNVQGSKITYISDTLCEYSQTLAEIKGSGELNTSYTIGLELISLTRGGEEYYYISDGHGDVRIITDEDGRIKTKYRYSGYGELIETSGDIENSHMYAGECYDEESGLYYLRARYMNPSTETFTGMDSYAGNISDPDTLHKYLYANGNPVKYVDPSGNEAQLSTQVVVGAIMNVLDNGQTICLAAYMNSMILAGATAFCDGSDNDIYNAFVAGFCIGLGLGAVAYFVMAISFVAYLEIFMYISAGAYALSSYDAINYAMNGEYKKAIVSAAFAFWSLDGFASLYKSFADINLMKGINITEKVEKAKEVLESENQDESFSDIGNGRQYSVLYEACPGKGKTRSAHRNAANKEFYNQMANDAQFKNAMDDFFGYDVMEYMKSGKSGLKNPSPDWVWHHPANNPNVIQLIPKIQHQAPILQPILHPGENGKGGFGLLF